MLCRTALCCNASCCAVLWFAHAGCGAQCFRRLVRHRWLPERLLMHCVGWAGLQYAWLQPCWLFSPYSRYTPAGVSVHAASFFGRRAAALRGLVGCFFSPVAAVGLNSSPLQGSIAEGLVGCLLNLVLRQEAPLELAQAGTGTGLPPLISKQSNGWCRAQAMPCLMRPAQPTRFARCSRCCCCRHHRCTL